MRRLFPGLIRAARGVLGFLFADPHGQPLTLLAAGLAAYGLLIPWLGIFTDDWTFLWTALVLGRPGMEVYFTLGNDRPFWGLLYAFFVPLIGMRPWAWHLFGIFWLWASGLSAWWIARLVWLERRRLALLVGLFFILYPGFVVQWASLVFGHMWLVYAAALASIGLSLKALRRPRIWLPLSALAVLLAAVNFLSLEYFILLELARPLLMFLIFREEEQPRRAAARTLKAWLPYLLLLGGVMVWRLFFFPLQQHKYQLVLLDGLRAEPLETLARLVGTMVSDIAYQSLARAWSLAFRAPLGVDFGSPIGLLYLGLCAGLGLIFYFGLRALADPPAPRRAALSAAAVGLAALAAAGFPFWMSGLKPEPVLMPSRFLMPFMFGGALLLAAVFSALPARRLVNAFLALTFALAAGSQFLNANEFRRAWLIHAESMWQLAWRVPGLVPGTAILTNDWVIAYTSDNTNSAELNLLIGLKNPAARFDHAILSIRETRLRTGQVITPGQPFSRDLMSGVFYGSTDKVVLFYWQRDECLRRLDAELDAVNQTLPEEIRRVVPVSNPRLITPKGQGNDFELPLAIFGPEPAHDWCYYQPKADEAAVRGDWAAAAAFADQALAFGPLPGSDAMLGAVFVEAYAHQNRWADAWALAEQMRARNPYLNLAYCRLWQRIERQTPASPERETILEQAYRVNQCPAP